MARFSEAKKLEAVEAVKGGTPAEDVAKKFGVKAETLQGWTGEKPLVLVKAKTERKPRAKAVHSPRARASGQVRAKRVPQAESPTATRVTLHKHSALKAMAFMWKSGLPVEAFREALALLEG